MYNNTQ